MKSKNYEEFVEKFKPKKTTDDCYTPPEIYEVVKDWACKEYGIDPETIVRPFWPGGDYENFDYPQGCTVLDNPPFSILAKIERFYIERRIHFFLFAPAMTAFSRASTGKTCNHIFTGEDIIFYNGAVVKTAFVTDYGEGEIARTAPDLGKSIRDVQEGKKIKRDVAKYKYPKHVITGAMLDKYSAHGINIKVKGKDCAFISALDEQKKFRKEIFGGGFLLSDKAAEENEMAGGLSKKHVHVWKLSQRELDIVNGLGR